MVKENISQEFRLTNTDETINYFLEEIKQNELIGRKLKKVCTTLSHIEHFLILVSTITGCVSTSAFASLIGIAIKITGSARGLKICAITAGINTNLGVGGNFTFPCWISLNNSETVKAVTLTFCSIQ